MPRAAPRRARSVIARSVIARSVIAGAIIARFTPRTTRATAARAVAGVGALWLWALLALLPAGLLGLSGPAAAQEAYRIGGGDVLRVEVIEDEGLNRTVLVTPDGNITFPLAGTVNAAGRTLGAVQSDLVSQLSPNFSNPPTVFVSLERLAQRDPTVAEEEPTIAIFVLGEAGNIGRLTVEPGTTLLQTFAQMGGFSNFAALKRVQLRRRDSTGVERIYSLNYKAIMDGTSPNGSVVMADGDVILVPTRRLFE